MLLDPNDRSLQCRKQQAQQQLCKRLLAKSTNVLLISWIYAAMRTRRATKIHCKDSYLYIDSKCSVIEK